LAGKKKKKIKNSTHVMYVDDIYARVC